MPRTRLLPLVLALPLALPFTAEAQEHRHPSRYAGLEDREIKALSAGEVEGLLEGDGMGMALPAELNGYPGPRHVLDLAGELGLDAGQRRKVREIFDAMHADATELGREIVELERELDGAFAEEKITAPELSRLTGEIGRKRAELRAVHLRAHLEVHPVLTGAQRAEYDRLRGYGRH